MIFLFQSPHSYVDITTNSSSEIFVLNKEDMAVAELLIEENGWRWWFGNPSIIDESNIELFIGECGHCLERLTDGEFEDFPSVPSQYDLHEVREAIDIGDGDLIYSSRYQHMANTDKYSPEFVQAVIAYEADKDYYKFYHVAYKERDLLIVKWYAKHDITKLYGKVYYSCGEDNELGGDVWEEIHMSIPGNYARLS